MLADLEPATLDDIAEAMRRHGVAPEVLDQLLSAFQGLGLLVGGLAFPRRYASAWDALFNASRELEAEHASLWRSSAIRLRRMCRRLERRMETIAIDELHDALHEIRSIPIALARALDVPAPALPRSILRCDTRLPFSVVLGQEAKDRLTQAVAEYDQFERTHGLDAAIRTAHRVRLLEPARSSPSSAGRGQRRIGTLESAWLASGADPVVGARLEHLSRWLEAPAHGGALQPGRSGSDLPLPPIGGLVLRPAGARYQIIGTTTEITASLRALRRALVWPGPAVAPAVRGARAPRVVPGCARQGREGRQRRHRRVRGSLRGDAEPPGRTRSSTSRCGTDGERSLRTEPTRLRVGLVDDTSVALACRAGDPRRIALTCFSPANVGFSEPHLERLLLSSFREVPTWLSQALPMECELARAAAVTSASASEWEHAQAAPYVRARRRAGGARGGEPAGALRPLAGTGPQACMAAARAGRARRARPALPVVRDSPLAVEVALRGISNHTRLLSVEEPHDHLWDVDEKGHDHVFEFIVPFLRRRHAWTMLAPGEPGAPG